MSRKEPTYVTFVNQEENKLLIENNNVYFVATMLQKIISQHKKLLTPLSIDSNLLDYNNK